MKFYAIKYKANGKYVEEDHMARAINRGKGKDDLSGALLFFSDRTLNTFLKGATFIEGREYPYEVHVIQAEDIGPVEIEKETFTSEYFHEQGKGIVRYRHKKR